MLRMSGAVPLLPLYAFMPWKGFFFLTEHLVLPSVGEVQLSKRVLKVGFH